MIKKIFNAIINFIKLIIFGLVNFITSLFNPSKKKEIINKQEINKEETTTKIVTLPDGTITTLPDTSNTKINPNLKPLVKDNEIPTNDEKAIILTNNKEDNTDNITIKELPFTNYEIDKIFNDVLESEFDIKVKYLQYSLKDKVDKLKIKLIPIIKEDIIKKDIYRKPSLVDQTKKRIDEELKEKPIKELEPYRKKKEVKEEIKKEVYIIATPINKELNLNGIQKVTQIPIGDDIKEEKKEEAKEQLDTKPFIVTPLVEEAPKIKLKDELATAIKASATVMAGISAELLTEEKKEEIHKEAKEITIELTPEKEIPVIEKIVEEKKEETKKKDESKKEETIIIPKIDLNPVRKEEEKINNNIKEENNKEDIEDKDYDSIEEKINQMLEQLEAFKLKNEKTLTREQKENIEREQERLHNMKEDINHRKTADLDHEEMHLEQNITIEEMNGLKTELKKLKVDHQVDLNENLLNNLEELDHLTTDQLERIEKDLIKRKLRKAARAAEIPALLALPFIRNKYFRYFTAGLLVNNHLTFLHGILRHQSTDISLPDLNNIQKGKHALNGAINITNENINYLNYLEGEALRKHPSLAKDKEYRTYVSNLRTKLTTSYTKLNRKQETIDRLFRRSRNKTLRYNKINPNQRPI